MAKTGPKGPSKPMSDAPKSAMVYGLCLDDGVIRYVGMTTNARNRFRAYRCHNFSGNDALRSWLEAHKGSVRYIELHSGIEQLAENERAWIKRLRPQLFNIVNGGVQSWRTNDRKPWSASRGVLCPSAWVLSRFTRAGNREAHQEAVAIRGDAISGMTDAERCGYELSIAMRHREIIPSRHQKWLNECHSRIAACLKGAEDGKARA